MRVAWPVVPDTPHVLVAPDKLKGVLSAREAAEACVRGFGAAGVAAEALPLADGGEGLCEALLDALGGEWRTATVEDALGRAVEARFGVLADGRAVVEAAEAIGLWRLDLAELDPLRASSRGLGQLLRAAADVGASSLIVGLGGSATVDGGAGLRETLDSLAVPTIVAADVRNPLLGRRGAARVFGPQKGATPDAVEELERRLAAMPELAPFADEPGAGAAGGLGAALLALGATLRPGIELVLEATSFERRAAGAALVVTGEGAVDATSLEGKTVGGVVAACVRVGARCVVFGGRVAPEGAAALRAAGAAAVVALSGDPGRARVDLESLARHPAVAPRRI